MTRLYVLDARPLEDPRLFEKYFSLTSDYRRRKILAYKKTNDRVLSLAAGILTRIGLSAHGLSERDAIYGEGPNGKPRFENFPDVRFNISHSGEVVIAAFSDREVGCDVEKIIPTDLRVAKRFFSPEVSRELEALPDRGEADESFYRYWTLIESCMKVTGLGMSLSPADIHVKLDGGAVRVSSHALVGEYSFFEYSELPGYRFSLACEGRVERPEPEFVTLRECETLKTGFKTIGKPGCLLGEGPYLDRFGGKFCQVDIDSKEFITVDADGCCDIIRFPQKPTCMAQTITGEYIVAMEDGIYTREMKPIAPRPAGTGARFNDGKAGPDGLFYVGTIEKNGNGALFRLIRGRLEPVIENVRISNGLDFTDDGKTVYYCDTMEHRIDALDFPTFEDRRTVFDFGQLLPDGLCLDAEGMIWVALWGSGRVVRIDTERGEIIKTIELPARYTSCPAFVGRDLDLLAVTSAKDELDLADEPYAGSTFIVDVGVKGRAPYLCDPEKIYG